MICDAPYLQFEFGDPRIFYVFNIILSFSTCSQSLKKICTWEILGANVLKCVLYFAWTDDLVRSLLACERRRISGCRLSPPKITTYFQLSLVSAENDDVISAETCDSRKYVCVRRLLFYHTLNIEWGLPPKFYCSPSCGRSSSVLSFNLVSFKV